MRFICAIAAHRFCDGPQFLIYENKYRTRVSRAVLPSFGESEDMSSSKRTTNRSPVSSPWGSRFLRKLPALMFWAPKGFEVSGSGQFCPGLPEGGPLGQGFSGGGQFPPGLPGGGPLGPGFSGGGPPDSDLHGSGQLGGSGGLGGSGTYFFR